MTKPEYKSPRQIADEEAAIKLDTKAVLETIARFDSDLTPEQMNKVIGIKGRSLQQALSEHPSWVVYYQSRRAELKKFVAQLEKETERIYGVYYKFVQENNSRDLNHNSIVQYVKAESKYNYALNVLSEVEEILHKFDGVCEALTSRGFQLRDFTNARINEVHNYMIE